MVVVVVVVVGRSSSISSSSRLTGLPPSSTIVDVLGQPLERLAVRQVGLEVDEAVGLLELAPQRVGVDLGGGREPVELLVELVVGGLQLLGRGDGPQRQVDLGALRGGVAQVVGERLRRRCR